jgi:hypothetical protein
MFLGRMRDASGSEDALPPPAASPEANEKRESAVGAYRAVHPDQELPFQSLS